MMTLEEFRATRKEVADLGAALADDGLAGVSGALYMGELYIEEAHGGGLHLLTLHNTQWADVDRSALEANLYEFACSEGYCGGGAL